MMGNLINIVLVMTSVALMITSPFTGILPETEFAVRNYVPPDIDIEQLLVK